MGFTDVKLDGIFVAKVLNNEDPYMRERLFVRVIGVHKTIDFDNKKYGVWVEHCAPSQFLSGDIPLNGTEVYVQFLRDGDGAINPMSAIWLGVVRKNEEI